MDTPKFRPWGLVSWLFPHLQITEWDFIGGLSAEDRSIAAWQSLIGTTTIHTKAFIRVQDPQSRYSNTADARSASIEAHLLSMGVTLSEIVTFPLFVRIEALIQFVRVFTAAASTKNVIVDISSLPKRFFFPIIKLLLKSKKIKNLVAIYTVPESYADGPLSENPDPWTHIPLFAPPYPEPELKVLIVGVGFEPLALPELYEDDYHDVSVKLLFPFPPGPRFFQRTWEFVRIIEHNLPHSAREPIRVDGRDVSDSFDHICAATENNSLYSLCAPYGPKPISLAMCLFANYTGVPIYYTQPKVYNPFYSNGVSILNGIPEIYAYSLRARTKDLYKI